MKWTQTTKLVVAIGGNSLITVKQHEDVPSQWLVVQETCKYIASKVEQEWNLIITHGNERQVRVLFRPLSQHYVLLTAERSNPAPFCKHLRGIELLDLPVEQFLASLHFDQRGKLDQLGIEMGTFE